jgi:hypothetical protein
MCDDGFRGASSAAPIPSITAVPRHLRSDRTAPGDARTSDPPNGPRPAPPLTRPAAPGPLDRPATTSVTIQPRPARPGGVTVAASTDVSGPRQRSMSTVVGTLITAVIAFAVQQTSIVPAVHDVQDSLGGSSE